MPSWPERRGKVFISLPTPPPEIDSRRKKRKGPEAKAGLAWRLGKQFTHRICRILASLNYLALASPAPRHVQELPQQWDPGYEQRLSAGRPTTVRTSFALAPPRPADARRRGVLWELWFPSSRLYNRIRRESADYNPQHAAPRKPSLSREKTNRCYSFGVGKSGQVDRSQHRSCLVKWRGPH
ncbi:uncharacterized protein LOC116543758 [Sapajus apella]|uniref:Uncharacterized protein LOC116543758 n=1 Tax=Sapajus apella TaxID=9515 RepID=A0A6J3H6P3_SAPAP|nr:uncharacterized protein LOC116543758 [Sapajus apella]